MVEAEIYPKRLNQWRAEDGTFVWAWYGPPKYGGGGAIDPQDKDRLVYAEGDGAAGSSSASTGRRASRRSAASSGDPSGSRSRSPDPPPKRAITVAGRTFLTSCFNGGLRYNQDRGAVIWRLDPDEISRPVAILANAADLNDPQWSWPMKHRHAMAWPGCSGPR